jgi:dihydroorotate dehydrogenase electron transfer subunit
MGDQGIFVWQARVLANVPIVEETFEIVLTCPCTADFHLGQFLCLEPLDPQSVMARPFSFYAKNQPKGQIRLLYRVAGKNTNRLSQKQPGQEIKAWGPLGRAISSAKLIDYDKVYLVGGGIGIAALCQWQHALKYLEIPHEVYYGNKTLGQAVTVLDFIGKVPIHLATDDGTGGYHGLVTQLFAEQAISNGKTLVLTCGPKPMMRLVAEISRAKGMECWVSLERIMACGLGACLGCSIETSLGMQRICCEGPIFRAEEVKDELTKA